MFEFDGQFMKPMEMNRDKDKLRDVGDVFHSANHISIKGQSLFVLLVLNIPYMTDEAIKKLKNNTEFGNVFSDDLGFSKLRSNTL